MYGTRALCAAVMLALLYYAVSFFVGSEVYDSTVCIPLRDQEVEKAYSRGAPVSPVSSFISCIYIIYLKQDDRIVLGPHYSVGNKAKKKYKN